MSSLAAGDVAAAVESGREAFRLARLHRVHQLLSEAWIACVKALTADELLSASGESREHVDDAFFWAETMPEEIQSYAAGLSDSAEYDTALESRVSPAAPTTGTCTITLWWAAGP